MDYKKILAEETGSGHVAYHEYAMHIEREPMNVRFLFFEGDEDPSFYMTHISHRLRGNEARQFICNGRDQVLKAHEMILRDGRGSERSLFFVDKDHNDLIGKTDAKELKNVFQTHFYSIENYLVSDAVFKSYWTQRLHLSEYDQRFQEYRERINSIMESFRRRSIIVTSLILCGRGINGRPPVKLNLNNVQLDKIFKINWGQHVCRFQRGAYQHFLRSTNLLSAEAITTQDLILIAKKRLRPHPPKSYIRGKYELWMFWRVLRQFTQELSAKDRQPNQNLKRASPTSDLPWNSCAELLAPLSICPPELEIFLEKNL